MHGFTVDEKGYKMSKSLGNVISPKQITKKYGTDVLRWWVASHGTQHTSITVSEKLLQQAAENLSKVRATLRYLNGAIGERQQDQESIPDSSFLNRYLLSQLVDFDAEVSYEFLLKSQVDQIQASCSQITKLYKAYEYNRVVAAIQNFLANQVSAVYVHLIKDRLYCGDERELLAIRQTLTHCYEELCKSLWPIVPFMVEESWSYYDPTGAAFHQQSVAAKPQWQDEKANDVVASALEVKKIINQQAGDVNSWHIDVILKVGNEKQLKLLQELHPIGKPRSNSELCEILQVGSVTLLRTEDQDLQVSVKTLQAPLCPRCRRYSLDNDEQETCHRCSLVMTARN